MIVPASGVAALLLGVLVGCEGPAPSERTAMEPGGETTDAHERVASDAASAPASADVDGQRTALTSLTKSRASAADAKGQTERGKRPVVYRGSVSLVTPVPHRAMAAFLDDVAAIGGYVGSRATTTVTVHVPGDKLFATLELLRDAGTVVEQSVNAGSVHGLPFAADNPRERIYGQARDRLRAMLESDARIKDALAMEAEVKQLSAEIELMKGAMRTHDDQDAFSIVTVTFLRTAPSLEGPVPLSTL